MNDITIIVDVAYLIYCSLKNNKSDKQFKFDQSKGAQTLMNKMFEKSGFQFNTKYCYIGYKEGEEWALHTNESLKNAGFGSSLSTLDKKLIKPSSDSFILSGSKPSLKTDQNYKEGLTLWKYIQSHHGIIYEIMKLMGNCKQLWFL